MFIYFLVCFLQPIMLPVPEPVTIMAGSAVFGPWVGAILGFLGSALGIITMFFISRVASYKLISKFVHEGKIVKFNKYIEKNETLMLLGLFILPILPDEIICIGAGLARINKLKFILVTVISKLITSISFSFSISVFNFSIVDILAVVIIVVIVGVIGKQVYSTLRKKRSVKRVSLLR